MHLASSLRPYRDVTTVGDHGDDNYDDLHYPRCQVLMRVTDIIFLTMITMMIMGQMSQSPTKTQLALSYPFQPITSG